MEEEKAYYRRRAAEERQAAADANSTEAKRVHQTMADHYSVKARIGE